LFSEAQKKAIEHYGGPAIVLAGPGSGKTTVITHRVKNLIEKYQVLPEHILVITFTKAAALEMKERFSSLTKSKYPSVAFGTFHAIYFTILKHSTNYNIHNLIHLDKQMNFIKSMLYQYGIETEDENETALDILSEISRYKNEYGFNKEQMHTYQVKSCEPEIFIHIYKQYDGMLKSQRLIDFDDMVLECFQLLSKRKDVLLLWQKHYQYILIDEFQDINKMQFEVIKMLAGKNHNIFIVGDDDQSIYGFRGAKPEIMLNFNTLYPDAVKVNLNTNFRSVSNIVNAAGKLIENNQKRYHKDIITDNEQGELVVVREFKEMEQEYEEILSRIKTIYQENGTYRTIAILTRTNAGFGPIVRVLSANNIPFKAREKVKNIFEHWIALDIIAYIRLAIQPMERKLFLRIMNKPTRYISRTYLTEDPIHLDRIHRAYLMAKQPWMAKRIRELMNDLRFLKNMPLYAGVNYIRKKIGYDQYLKDYAKEHRLNVNELLKILDEVHESTKNHHTFDCWLSYTNELTLQSEEHNKGDDPFIDAITLSTMHGAKGLEYSYVFIVDITEGNIPYNKAVLEDEIEEERRIFYVAMTRAKKCLFLYYTNERYNRSLVMSRFLKEMESPYVRFELIESAK
jgi:DNA helicase-2/ATP-dependent DNA helicase PcrA